ncbi:hypothetical protein [Gryllotalpicola reticulitermitis]|uniref:hypothetical protein n=1 Tax=Gryllotalpicola reticulitermitis TaxID=1184153 RepID=UPI0036F43BD9
MLLVDSAGSARALKTGPMDRGHLTWGSSGLSFSDATSEYVISDEGLTATVRGSEEAYETSRFLSPDGDGFIAVYNVGFGDREYLARVTTGDGATTRSWDTVGMYESVGQCGDRVVATTDIAETGAEHSPAAPRVDVLVQLYPEPPRGESAILATLPVKQGSFVMSASEAPCADGTLFALALQHEQPDGLGNSRPVLRAWNISAGKHEVIPLVTGRGAPIDVDDDLLGLPASIVGGRYVWVTVSGQVFSTDLSSGVTTRAFEVSLTSPEMGESQYVFTPTSLFVLDVGQNLRAPLGLDRYDLATGKRTRVLSIPGTGAVHHGLDMVIRDLALNPDWVNAQSSSEPETGRTSGARR